MSNHSGYNFDDIDKYVSAKQIAEMHGVEVVGNRCKAVWRGGENDQSVSFSDDGKFYDFATKEGGGAVKLLSLITGRDMRECSMELGDRYCPQPKKQPRQSRQKDNIDAKPMPSPAISKTETIDVNGQTIEQSAIVVQMDETSPAMIRPPNPKEKLFFSGWVDVAVYDYLDPDGNVSFRVHRLEKDGKKTFLQQDVKNKCWNIRNAEKLPYNLPSVIKAKEVWIVEGEKDANTLIERGICATTNNGGAGNWALDCMKYLAGKDIVICADNDSKGKAHAELIARGICGRVKSLKIIVPSDQLKGDVTDYLMGGAHTINDLFNLALSTPTYVKPKLGAVTKAMKEAAKEANKKPFCNYYIEEEEKEGGGKKFVKRPRALSDMILDLQTRCLGFPLRIGNDSLFDYRRDTDEISFFTERDRFFAWISLTTKQNVGWLNNDADGFHSKSVFFQSFLLNATRCDRISLFPCYPEYSDVFYHYPDLPQPSVNYSVFEQLIDFFNPQNDGMSRNITKSLFASPMWYRKDTPRPGFLIDSNQGKGVGKTTLVKMVAYLYKSRYIESSAEELRVHPDELKKRLVSAENRKANILMLDNVVGEFSSDILSSMITSSDIAIRAPYSRGEDVRQNDLTFVITANAARLDSDLATRFIVAFLDKPISRDGWEERVRAYIDQYRWQIFADMLDMIKKHIPYNEFSNDRFAVFSREIIQPMCGSEAEFIRTMTLCTEYKAATNYDAEDAEQVEQLIWAKICALSPMEKGICRFFVSARAIKEWFKEENLTRRRSDQFTQQKIIQYAKDGHVKRIDARIERLRFDGRQARGILFTPDAVGENSPIRLIDRIETDRGAYLGLQEKINGNNIASNNAEF